MKEIYCDLCKAADFINYMPQSGRAVKLPGEYRITESHACPPDKIVQCVSCGLVYVPQGGDAQTLHEYYRTMVDERYAAEEQSRRLTAKAVLKKLVPFQRDGNRLLDVGCSLGFFLVEAQLAGWEVQGVELSEWAASQARKHYGLTVHNTTLRQARLPPQSFDVIVLQDTLEHLESPRETLTEIRRLLRPAGVVFLNTPDIESLPSRVLGMRWWGIHNFHLFYFSRRTLARLLRVVGLQPIIWTSFPRNFSWGYLIHRLRRYNPAAAALLRCAAVVMGGETRIIAINNYEQIGVIARNSGFMTVHEDGRQRGS